MSQMNGSNPLRRAQKKDISMKTGDSSSESFCIQIIADEIRMSNFLRQTDTQVKSQEVAKLCDVQQGYFEMAYCLRVTILIGLLN